MDCAEIQKSKLVTATLVSAPSSANPPPESCIWVDAGFPCSSSSGINTPLSDSITLCPNVMKLDQPAAAFNPHVANTFALQFVSSPSPVIFSPANDRPPPFSCADKAPPPPSRHEFMQSFVNTLLPQLKRIHSRSSSISPQAKFSAVRVAADMSLAVSARGNNNNIWSRTLLQELSSPYSNKVGVRKNHRRCPPSRGSKIYARILRRCSISHAMRIQNCSRASGIMRMSSQAFGRTSRNSHQASRGSCAHVSSSSGSLTEKRVHAVRCRKCDRVCRMQHAMSKRRCGLGLPSYVKVLRNSRAAVKSAQKAAAESGNKASRVQTSRQISKEQVASLGGLVPGGRNMDVPLLFKEAADYILSLQMQVEALQALSHSVLL